MPTLNWIGKDAVVNHHLEVPFHLLKDVPDLSCGDPGSGNLIVEGDNLVALKALLPYYKGKVKCIYIDPPYNTGNEGWAYNDNVKSPIIDRWLKETLAGKTVGGEGETLDRHDRWLCMMYPRLSLLRDFLSDDGTIWISLDDNEVASLRFLMDEVFGRSNFVADVIWRSADSSNNDAKTFSLDHNHTIIYSKSEGWMSNLLPRNSQTDAHYKNPDNDPRGSWFSGNVSSPNPRENLRYVVTSPNGHEIRPPANGWRWSVERMQSMIKTGEICFTPDGKKLFRKTYLADQKGLAPSTLWSDIDATGHNRNAKYEIAKLFPEKATSELFKTPKPTLFIERILQIATNPGDLILDSFAGSGTTGHAVLKMNAANPEGEPRRLILVEMEPDVVRDVTAERVRRVAGGYTNAKGDQVDGLGGGFRYVTLGDALFDETGQIRHTVRFAELARHVYFTETGEPLPKERVSAKTPLLGIHRGKAIYLLYNGILSDRSIGGGNALCRETLQVIDEINAGHEGIDQTVVYGTSQRLSPARLKRGAIDFKQIPYNLRIS